MLHLVFCPNCGENVKVLCDNVPNPFQQVQADQIARILCSPLANLTSLTLSHANISHLKLLFLLDMIGDDLPEIDELPKLPPLVEDCIHFADADTIKHIMIQAVGRWDEIGKEINMGAVPDNALML